MKHKSKINNNISQYEVDCPRSIQRKMRSNLAVASRAKVNKVRVDIAKAILTQNKYAKACGHVSRDGEKSLLGPRR